MLRQFGAKMIDLLKHLRHVHHVAHGKAWIDLLQLGHRHQATTRFDGFYVPASTENIKTIGDPHRLSQQFRGENLLLPPDHAILQLRVDLMLGMQTMMHHLDVVHETDEHVGSELSHEIEVKRAEQAVTPAKCRVGVDNDVGVVLHRQCLGDDVFEDRSTQACEAAQGKVEHPPGTDIRGFLVHHVAHVEDFDPPAAFAVQIGHRLQIRLLVHADLSGHDDSHLYAPEGLIPTPAGRTRKRVYDTTPVCIEMTLLVRLECQ